MLLDSFSLITLSCFFVSSLKFFDEVYDSFKFWVLEFLSVIFIGKHFHRTSKFWRGNTGLVFHIACISVMRT